MTHVCTMFTVALALLSPVRRALAAAALLGVGVAAAAGDAGNAGNAGDFSVGLSAGANQGRVDCVASFPCEHRSTHLKLTAGYRLTEAVDVQALYFGAGRLKGGNTTPLGTQFGGTFKVNGFGLRAGYRWSLTPLWSVTARAGLASVRTRFVYANPVWASASRTTAQPLVGVGVAYAVTPALRVGLDYDLTRFKVHTTRGRLQMLGVAAQFSF